VKSFRKTSSDDPVIQKFQENVDVVLKPVLDAQILDGTLLTNISLVSGTTNLVEHKLGREPLGYLVTSVDTNCNVWSSQATNIFKTRTLALETSSNCKVSLWVF
jgi:hypothetical protein